LARAKNTSRSEARRRTREESRAEMASELEPEDGGEAVATTSSTTAIRPPRKQLFAMPDIRSDVRALPDMFQTRRLLWLPFVLVLVGFIVQLIGPGLAPELQNWIVLYVQYFFLPSSLFTYFIGGFLAPRGAYLIGFLLGVSVGVAWTIILLLEPEMQAALGETTDIASAIGVILLESIVFGTFAGGFAGWYRDFLRRMQTNSKDRQQQRDAQVRAKRRDDRQEQRRSAKQRPAG
jgi:hypothetical protein